jgi:hypothetical protein
MEQGRKFKAMFSSLGFTVADVANFLQVSPRTVQLWVSGRVRIPHAAYKLMRLQLRYELPGKDWEGWHLSAGRLYTPEGHELNPRDFTWWSLLVRRAAMFDVLYRKQSGASGFAGQQPSQLPGAGRSAPAAAGRSLRRTCERRRSPDRTAKPGGRRSRPA